jgi:ABC-type uncharacterized transport system involved in gliding motility auxiliary subunit
MPNLDLTNLNGNTTSVTNTTAFFDQLGKQVDTMEKNISTSVQELKGQDMTSAQMLAFQYQLSKWQLATQLESQAMKSVADGIKGTIQNLR